MLSSLFLVFLISKKVNLGYNLKYYEPDLTQRDIVEIEVRKMEDEINLHLRRNGVAKIGEYEIRLDTPWKEPFGPIRLELISYKITDKKVEAKVRVEVVKEAKIKATFKGDVISVGWER